MKQYCYQQDVCRRCEHIRLLMRSDNRSLFALTNKLVAERLLNSLKGKMEFERCSSNRLARGPFCVTSALHVIPSWTGANGTAL